MPAQRVTFRVSAETGAVLLFAVAAVVSGLRSALVNAGVSTPSADMFALASALTVGVAAGAAVVLFGELLVPPAGWTTLRRLVRRLPVWFSLVAVVALGVVAEGGSTPGDEPVLTFILSAQLVMFAVALVPFALASDAS